MPVNKSERRRILVDAARNVLSIHRTGDDDTDSDRCRWCLRPWPCVDAQWASEELAKHQGKPEPVKRQGPE